jgi:NADPH:quinone reductase-like Zn-dependent oxidoreductase
MTQNSIPKTMRAAVIEQFGGVEQIKIKEVPVPKSGADEVLIRIEAAGVGVWDVLERQGGFAQMFNIPAKFPYIIGTDCAGTIAATGENVTEFREGERVYASILLNPKGGFYAEYGAVNAENVGRAPQKLSVEELAVMPSDAMTGLQGLADMLKMKAGETVMIFGASGGIGHLAVQLAKRLGARVFAVASGDDGVALAKNFGADAVVNGRKEDVVDAARQFAPNGIDAALMTAGGEAAERALQSVRDGGRVTFPNGVMPEPEAREGLEVSKYDVEINRASINRLNRLIEAGPFHVEVARTFPLEQAAEAHRTLDQHYLGKIALRIR